MSVTIVSMNLQDKTNNSENILKALRIGAVPSYSLGNLAIGIDNELKELTTELNYISNGHSSIKFIQGDYGSGKTFLTQSLSEIARQKNFSVSTVVVSPTNQINNLSNIYRTIVDNLKTPKSKEGSGLTEIIDAWSFRIFDKTLKVEGANKNVKVDSKIINTLSENIEFELISSQNINPAFAKCIVAYAESKLLRNSDKSRMAISWLKGSDKISNSQFVKELGLKSKLENKEIFSLLKGLSYLIKESGYNGMLIIFDEIETIQRSQNKKLRQDSYEIIRSILDEVALDYFKNIFFIFAGTINFFEDKRYGIHSYQALYERISKPISIKGESPRQPILKLKKFDENMLRKISEKILELHSEVNNWNAKEKIDKVLIHEFISKSSQCFGEIYSKPRDYIRSFVNFLDLVNENPSSKASSFIDSSINN